MNESKSHVLCHNAKNLVCTITSALDIIEMEGTVTNSIVLEMLHEIQNATDLLTPMLTEMRDLVPEAP